MLSVTHWVNSMAASAGRHGEISGGAVAILCVFLLGMECRRLCSVKPGAHGCVQDEEPIFGEVQGSVG